MNKTSTENVKSIPKTLVVKKDKKVSNLSQRFYNSECIGEESIVEIASEIHSKESRDIQEKDLENNLSQDLSAVLVERKDVRKHKKYQKKLSHKFTN
ncbi:unnamed protein product [Diabrotica balteata]|uniref:Uncharacterized protein n=1 Tax=Diabrotica balteata TaxID=107213 RepID=A0A9P0DXL4_DIABA|nr:unnamed protein product [Diabrotica balteata]